MAIRQIRLLGDPILRTASAPAEDGAAAVLEDLKDTLHEFQRTHGFGRGISAVQIGHLIRVIYLEFEGKAYSLVNPEYTFRSDEKFQLWDDCFSFPDVLVWLERSLQVGLSYMDEKGIVHTLEATGPLSELIQHEMDHLDGYVALDRALGGNTICLREEWKRRYADRGDAP